MERYVSEQEYDSVEAEEPTTSVTPEPDAELDAPAAPTLEDQYGEPNDGPEVEDDPRLDAEVTDEDSDEAMGLDDTEADGATSLDMSEAEGDEGPADQVVDGADGVDGVDENDPLEAFRR